jgi:hypothetical protein
VVDGAKYMRYVLERLGEDARDGEISRAEALKAVHDIAKAPGDYGLKVLKEFTAEAQALDKDLSVPTGILLDDQQKEDAYAAFNPLEKFMFWRFALSVAMEQEDPHAQPATNYSSLLGQINSVASSSNLTFVQAKSKTAMVRLFPEWLLSAYRVLFAPFQGLSTVMIAGVTQFGSQWLMGPSALALKEREGAAGKDLVLKIEKCRFLEESGPCVKTCVHACKVPTQEFFQEQMGLPVAINPNMTSLGCEFVFGVAPKPLSEDPVVNTPCFSTCEMKARHKEEP